MGRGSKVLWMFRGDLLACTQGVRGQPFSIPLYTNMKPHKNLFLKGAPNGVGLGSDERRKLLNYMNLLDG